MAKTSMPSKSWSRRLAETVLGNKNGNFVDIFLDHLFPIKEMFMFAEIY